jgi:FAD/FMN-containing dehydrogenase
LYVHEFPLTDLKLTFGLSQIHDLSEVLNDKIVLPDHHDYAAIKSSYYSLQAQELSPACVVRPTSTKDVVTAIKALVSHDVPFAVKGGGHSLNAGAANIESGVTIDLRSLNEISLNEDHTIVSIGGGAKWIEVYSYLDQFGLAVAGGRVGDVGVAGLVLGGKAVVFFCFPLCVGRM